MQTTDYKGYEAVFGKEDRGKTVLIPWFTDFLSPMIPAIASLAGYTFVNCPKTSKKSADVGLMYGNNEVCYPATLVLGDLIAEIQTGRYPLDQLAVAITQTGGQCRATNYIAHIKNGLKNAGYGQIPVIAIAFGGVHNNRQPGFRLPLRKIFHAALNGLLFGDAMGTLLNASVVRERNKGDSKRVFDAYLCRAEQLIRAKQAKQLPDLLEEAVDDFNRIEVIEDRTYERIGLLGEIFVKYNSYGQAHLTQWLQDQGVEVVLPSMGSFFMQTFVNARVNARNGLERMGWIKRAGLAGFCRYFDSKMIRFDRVMQRSRYYTAREDIAAIARDAEQVIDLSHQFGEGWLIAGEVAQFVKKGIYRVVCVQPFGCIANHVVAKGIERRLKREYPGLSLLFLDIDGGMAAVNLQNRLKFLLAD